MIIEDGEIGETRPMFTSIFSFSPYEVRGLTNYAAGAMWYEI